LKITHTWLI